MSFSSILFLSPSDEKVQDTDETRAYFEDLNLPYLIETVTAGKEQYHLQPYFHMPLGSVDAVNYRLEVFRNLEQREVHASLQSFATSMQNVRQSLARSEKLYYSQQKQRWFLDAVATYIHGIRQLNQELSQYTLSSRGLLSFSRHLQQYVESLPFTTLAQDVEELSQQLARIHYTVHIKGNAVNVTKTEADSTDYSATIESTFAKFRQGAVKDYHMEFHESQDMNHVEANILAGVAQLYPDTFRQLEAFCKHNRTFMDGTITRFDREIQFYIAYLESIAPLQRNGLSFCSPHVVETSKEVYSQQSFDLALAFKLLREGGKMVCNDFRTMNPERILVITGPNQGGKTTFARAFGQLHYLAHLGCPVPGSEANLFFYNHLLTHFEREEKLEDLKGRLQNDLVRIHDILEVATDRSIIILNEVFSSTSLMDELLLSKVVLRQIMDMDALCVCVTFVEELAQLGTKTVSMVTVVPEDNPTLRTFRVVRKAPMGHSFALALAEKYALTYDAIKERMAHESSSDA